MTNAQAKNAVLDRIAGVGGWWKAPGRDNWGSKNGTLHTRCRSNAAHGTTYAYNFGPAALKMDYQVWICGKPEDYYLIPSEVVRKMYAHQKGYVDKAHPNLHVANIDVSCHKVTFATEAQRLNFAVIIGRPLCRNQVP